MPGVHLTPPQALNVLLTVMPRMLNMIMWLTFSAIHLALIVLSLLTLWLYQVTPADIRVSAIHLFQTETVQGAAAVLGFLGLSGIAVLLAYVKALRKIYGYVTASYLVEGL